jgi:uncharacterized protein YhfF
VEAGRPKTIDGLPVAEFAFPGPVRDKLVAAILRGEKTATASLRAEYRPEGAEELPQVGERFVVVDSEHRPVAIIETTEVRVLPAGQVDEQFARDEGEGFESVADWRAAHERFWGATPEREAAGEPAWTVDDGTLVVCERFRLGRVF